MFRRMGSFLGGCLLCVALFVVLTCSLLAANRRELNIWLVIAAFIAGGTWVLFGARYILLVLPCYFVLTVLLVAAIAFSAGKAIQRVEEGW